MPDIRFKTQPHAQQIAFMNASEREQLFGGAKRGGKSVAIAQKIVMLSMAFPGNRGLLYRQNLTDLKDSTLVTFEDVCPSGIIQQHHKGDRRYTFVNKSWFIYRGVGDKDELEKVKGIDLGWMAGDEPTEVEFQTYLMLLAQMNWKLPGGKRPPYMSMLASNPEPGWVKQRFIDIPIGPGTPHPDRIFIPSLPRHNPYLPAGYEDYLRANFPGEWVEKYLEGSWEVSEGMVFKEFDRKTHVVDSYPPLHTLKLYASIDHATTGVTCFMVIGVDSESNFWAIREYYQKDKLVADHAAAIRNVISQLESEGQSSATLHQPDAGKLEYILIDPATSQRSSQGNYQLQSVRDLYMEAGINTIPAWNVLEAGMERLKQLIHPVPSHLHPITERTGAPHFFIVGHRCPNLVTEFLGLKREVDESGWVKYKGADHALDNCRYIAVSRPIPPQMSPKDEMAAGSLNAFASRSHERWASAFDHEVRKQNGLGGSSYY